MNKYIFATSNQHKFNEVSQQLPNIQLINLNDIGFHDSIVEDGSTLEENALLKASVIYKKYNIACISDDTGLEVDALQGQPGVLSARYAGTPSNTQKNIAKLLHNLKGSCNRSAKFRTVVCLKNKVDQIFFEGVVNGVIAFHSMGNMGFGYDSIFIPDGYKKTFSEISLEEKNKISHRSQAIQKMAHYLCV